MENKIYEIYQKLYQAYGPQGWWPFLNDSGEPIYHKSDFSFPQTDLQRFEVCVGSILTQNTTFTSVVTSLQNLKAKNVLSPETIQSLPRDDLKEAIRPCGYFNQKSRYILAFIEFYQALKGCTPSRDELLSVVGIGEETADSMLLYAYKKEEFKVDAYTKRILVHLGMIDEKAKYGDVKKLIEDALEDIDDTQRLIVYQEFHALIVHHAKSFYSKKPYGQDCFLRP